MIRAEALNLIALEHDRAIKKHPTFPTAHHGYAVILDEVQELWDEVRAQNPDHDKMRREAVQIGAMAVRFLLDVVEPEKRREEP